VALYLIDIDNNLALEACDESLKRCQDSPSLFFTQATFAKILRQLSFSEKTNLQKALDSAKTALAFDLNDIPPDLQEKARRIRQRVLMIRAECEEELGNHNEAVAIYQQARAEHPESSGGLLESVANILSKSGQYYELMSIVETWGLEDRLYWLAYNEHMDFGMSEGSANAIYQKAAKLASNPSASSDHISSSVNGAPAPSTLDLMVKRYKEMIEYLGRRNESACMRYQLAHAYWRVIGDAASAKNLYDSILNGDSCIDPATGSESTEVLMTIRFDLADLIFEEFRSSTDQQQKLGLLKELEEIPDRRLGKNIGELGIFNSQTAVMLARMIKKVRPAQDFQDQMEKVFEVCMTALTDSVGWNDQFSFYILSKVLNCLPGLERDALISISLQISLVDPALPLREHTPSEDGSEDETEDAAERQAENEAEEGAKNGAEREVPHPLSPPQETTVPLTPDNPHDNGPEAEEGKVNVEAPTDLRLSTSTSIAMVNGMPWNEEQITTSDVHLSAQSTAPPASPTWAEPPEGRAPWAELSCNGGCGRSCGTWAEMGHLYMCLICAACDLCQECYDKRQKMNAGDQTVSWRSFCGQDHEYLKGPIEGWKGVKAGMIRIGDEEPVAFKEWLRGLQEERWKAAWRAFWKGG
jgi:tetratricopeptide (TPR) repeat protein